MPFIAKKLPVRRPSPIASHGNIGLLAIFAVGVVVLHLFAAALLQPTAKEAHAPSPAASMLDSD